jgi:hypothetical protein
MATQPITVRLLVYSGRPDPEWTLDMQAADDLARRVRDAASGQSIHAPAEGGLGYRGFRITGGEALGMPREFGVFRGVLSALAGPRSQHWLDAGLEQFLLEDARRRGFAEVLSAAGAPRGGTTAT